MLNLVIFGSGRGTNFDAIYENIINGQLQASIVAVFSNIKDAPMVRKSRDRGLVTHIIPHHGMSRREHEEDVLYHLDNYDYDIVVLAGYMRIISEYFITRVGKPIINIHPSLLPAFPGLHAQKQALDFGVKVSGCTVHIVIPEVDAGPILGQKCVPVLVTDDVDSLSQRILEEEHVLFSEVLRQIEDGRLKITDLE